MSMKSTAALMTAYALAAMDINSTPPTIAEKSSPYKNQTMLTPKQLKVRARNKAAKQSRKRNRK